MMRTDSQRMKTHLDKALDSSVEDRVEELLELQELVEDIDNANALITMKAVAPLVSLLSNSSEEIQAHAAWVLGTCAVNNERFTKELLSENGFLPLLALLREDAAGEVLTHVVSAVAACVRASREALDIAMAQNSFKTLISLFSIRSEINLKRKLVFFFGGVIVEHSQVDTIISHLLANQLLESTLPALNIDDLDLQEKIMEMLDALASQSPAAISHITNSALKGILQKFCQSGNISAENKPLYTKVLSRVGIALN